MPDFENLPRSTEGIDSLVFEVLNSLKATENELELSTLYLAPLVELANGGKVLPIDARDSPGGFGEGDLWIATVVPVLAVSLGLLRDGQLTTASLEAAVQAVDRRVRSPRARREQRRLIDALGAALSLPVGEKG